MAHSSVPAAKAYIIALLEARPAFTGVAVSWAAPTESQDYGTGDNVWLGDVRQEEEWAQIGAARKREDYELDLVVQAWRRGDDPQDVEQRAWELQNEVSDALRADLQLGGILNDRTELSGTVMETRPFDEGWTAKGTVTVRCQALI